MTKVSNDEIERKLFALKLALRRHHVILTYNPIKMGSTKTSHRCSYCNTCNDERNTFEIFELIDGEVNTVIVGYHICRDCKDKLKEKK